ncbi:peptidase M48 [Thiocapsa imhoffii]|uniref:Peptidase M48 n=1 Tax=Thiocapsa imhoffii TaxID=382777 RepID=A0A9X1B7E0_9GAMM|nr:M48 family metallopeptidase [Thiocapsa imhoffii]MBK1643577.1 peptidase M48 [Thiocapsa imhoffii]
MNFFERQDQARRRTRLLVVLFALAVISIILTINLAALAVLGLGTDPQGRLVSPDVLREHGWMLVWISFLTAGAIALASLFRILTLRGGGGQVAQGLGGVLVPPDTTDPQLLRLRNVVEEMSIAAGVPVPQIYVLEQEAGINAFAAGYSPADAAVAVTRGTLETLSRAELQGVIAHEFSHILNGDMRLNVRLIGILFGILALAMLGRLLLAARRARASRETAVVVAVGLALVITGYIGLFFGRLIRASVSRQREFLADASAVQFTRDPAGIAGALKKIGALQAGSTLQSDSEEVGHMLFAAGLSNRLLATHPPLLDRIRAIEPNFDPSELKTLRSSLAHPGARAATPSSAGAAAIASSAGFTASSQPGVEPESSRDASQLIDRIGRPDTSQIEAAARLTRALPEPLARAARSTEWVVPLVCYLLIDAEPEIRDNQLLMIASTLGAESERHVGTLLSTVPSLAADLRIPLLEIAFPSLRRRPESELEQLMTLVDQLIHADGRVEVFEYVLARLLSLQIQDAMAPSRVSHAGGTRLRQEPAAIHDVLLILAIHGNREPTAARAAFAAGLAALNMRPQTHEPIRAVDWPDRLDRALARLDRLRMDEKEQLLRALLACAQYAGVNPTELELLRAISAALHVPMPVLS